MNLPPRLVTLGRSLAAGLVRLDALASRVPLGRGRIGRWLWRSLLGTLLLAVFLWFGMPTRAIAWRIGHEAKRAGYNVEIGNVSLSPFGGITLEEVQWTFTPSRPGDVPTTFVIDRVDVDIALWRMLLGQQALSVHGTLPEGTFEIEWRSAKAEKTLDVVVADLPLYAVPKFRQALNAPLAGTVALEVHVAIPEGDYEQTTGTFEISCTACRVGDGETLLFIPGSTGLMAKGVTVPEISLGDLQGRMVFENGVGATEGAISATSDDLRIAITGSIDFENPVGKSKLDVVLEIEVLDALQKRAEALRLLVQTAPESQRLAPPKSGMGYRLAGSFSRPRFTGINAKSREDKLREKREKARLKAEQKRQKEEDKRRKAEEAAARKGGDGSAGSEPAEAAPPPSAPVAPAIGLAPQILPAQPSSAPALPPPEAPAEVAPAEAPALEGEAAPAAPPPPPAEGSGGAAPPEGGGMQIPVQ
jgi:type II secretion system protein N